MRRILLIDDDERLAAPLARFFSRFDVLLDSAVRPGMGLSMLQKVAYDAAILDVMLPEMDGFELCRSIRRSEHAFRDIPLIMLTARGEVMDRVIGLELGADDYLPKPFEPRELLARLQTVLRRARAPAAAAAPATPLRPQRQVRQLHFDGLSIDLDRRQVYRRVDQPAQRVAGLANVDIELTSTEFDLLALLAGAPGTVFDRDQILNRLRGHEADLQTRAVDILVSRLRKKLEPLDCIKTLRNVGYTFAGARL